jgi:hypothetical protein
MYNGKNLVKDFDGKNPVKWSLNVVSHLFTEKELRENCLLASNRTSRGALSPNRVQKLKDAMNKRFKLTPVKSSKWFSEINEHVNTKGRNLKKKLNQLSTTSTARSN